MYSFCICKKETVSTQKERHGQGTGQFVLLEVKGFFLNTAKISFSLLASQNASFRVGGELWGLDKV